MTSEEKNEKEKILDHCIQRFRTIGNRTSNIGLAFLFLIVYTYLNSLEPNCSLIQQTIDAQEKAKHFDSLTVRIEKYKTEEINEYQDFKNDSTKMVLLDAPLEYHQNRKKKIEDLDNLFKLGKKHKQTANNNTDSLKKRIKVVFDIPTLSSIELNIRYGIILWLTLVAFFFQYFQRARQRMLFYINKALAIHILDFNRSGKAIQDLDSYGPFWFVPLKLIGVINPKEQLIYQILGWNNYTRNLIIAFSVILCLLLLQIHIAWLSWNINSLDFFPNPGVYKVLTLAAIGLTVYFVTSLTVPLRIQFEQSYIPKSKTNTRREFLRITIPTVTLVTFFSLTRILPNLEIIPLIKAAPLNYRRSKKRKNLTAGLKEGFYKHNKSGIIHYVSEDGKCPSLRSIDVEHRAIFLQDLKKIEIGKVIEKNTIKHINKIILVWALEIHILNLVKSKNLNEALENLRNVIEVKIGHVFIRRLIDLYCGLIVRYEEDLGLSKYSENISFLKRQQKKLSEEHYEHENYYTIKEFMGKLEEKNKRFMRKWKETDTLPWNN